MFLPAPKQSLDNQKEQARKNRRIRNRLQASSAVDWRQHEYVGRAVLQILQQPRENDQQVAQQIHDQMQLWKFRMSQQQQLPHAVESTLALVTCLLRDNERPTSTMVPILDDTALQLMYASAILRTINGYSDSMQQSRANVISVASSCSQLGIPAWLVNIRHEATHNQLPSLPVLRIAARALLQYNASVYWEPLASHRWQAYAQAMESLQQYDKFAKEVEYWTASRTKQSGGDNARDDNDDDDDDDDEGIPEHDDDKYEEEEEELKDRGNEKDVDNQEPKKSTMSDPRMPVNSILGTNFNSFAALMDEKPKKKAKQSAAISTTSTSSSKNEQQQKNTKVTPTAQNEKPTSNKIITTIQKPQPIILSTSEAAAATPSSSISSPPIGSPYQVALKFIKLKIPISVAYDAILDFLVGTISRSGIDGVFWQMDVAFETLCHLYRPLLTATCRNWPGFLRRLVNTLVHRLVMFENEEINEDEKDGRMEANPNGSKIQAANLWIRYLLSSKFLSGIDPHVRDTVRLLSNIHQNNDAIKSSCDNGSNRNINSPPSSSSTDATTMTPLQVLQYLKIPLNGLCDQYGGLSKEKYPTTVTLVEQWTNILGDERTPHFGLNLSILGAQTSSDDTNQSMKERKPKQSTVNKRPLTLEEMEAFLSDDDEEEEDSDGVTNRPNGSSYKESTTSRVVWLQCTSWEPCPLGTLPGCVE